MVAEFLLKGEIFDLLSRFPFPAIATPHFFVTDISKHNLAVLCYWFIKTEPELKKGRGFEIN